MLLRSVVILFCLQQAWSQTQIDLQAQSRNANFTGQAATSPVASGATLPATCTVGEMFFLTNVAAGSNLYGCAATNAWSLESGASGGGGGGAAIQNASQLTDLMGTVSSSTTLTIGATCSPATPCNARLGSVTLSFTSPTSATISAGTGTAFVYLDSSGNLTVGHNLTVSCAAGCLAVSGITAFPSDSLPLFTWTATNGTWNAGGVIDQRAFQSTANVYAGTGLLGVTSGGKTTLSIDPTLVAIWAAVPATSSSACTPGVWSTDGNYFYICVATNSWRRAALSTF